MEIVYHPLVRGDVQEALIYYRKISARLANEFHADLKGTINRAAENPLRFHQADQGFRRANLSGPGTLRAIAMPRDQIFPNLAAAIT